MHAVQIMLAHLFSQENIWSFVNCLIISNNAVFGFENVCMKYSFSFSYYFYFTLFLFSILCFLTHSAPQ